MPLPLKKKTYKITKKKSTNTMRTIGTIGTMETQQADKTHKYTKYYPSILDPAFSHKLATHNLFKKYKSTLNKSRL